jgi:L-gulonate 3-dehydrogenase
MKAAIVGAGLIGRAWAIAFARGGADVVLYDENAKQSKAALIWADATLPEMAGYGLIDDPVMVRRRIRVAETLADALSGAGYVQENIVERAEPKQQLFSQIEALADPAAILASSSSAIMPSIIFGKLMSRARCLVAHPMNPPHLAPIVELCGADFTLPETLERAEAFMLDCGMVPIKVAKEIEGFILNRLQFAVLNEALRLIEGGYVSPADLDKTIKDGLGLRWSFMGPIETMDLNAPSGIADYMQRYGETIRRFELGAKQAWSPQVANTLEASCRENRPLSSHSDAQAWRDQRLMALAKHKRDHSHKV